MSLPPLKTSLINPYHYINLYFIYAAGIHVPQVGSLCEIDEQYKYYKNLVNQLVSNQFSHMRRVRGDEGCLFTCIAIEVVQTRELWVHFPLPPLRSHSYVGTILRTSTGPP